jgi:tetratricopeptide (TPR) repeat protein
MRRFLFLLFLIPGFASADDFTKANEAYAAGKFEEARRGYEEAIKHGAHANAYFNQGNAFFRLKDAGRAVVAYERALLLQPNHPEAAANLKFVRSKTGAPVADEEWKEKAWRYIAQPAAIWAGIGTAWIGLLVIGVAMLGRKSRTRLVLGVLLFVVGAGSVTALHLGQAELAKIAIVVAERSDARTEPADRAALAESLPAGSRVQVISAQGDWTYCSLPNGMRGWVPTKNIEPLVPKSMT